ncbi:MAG TPA: FecR family protein [Spirochaetota bacterium]|nr:FecR family protein [Spirochaetota bacterium]HPC42911.1 FecR family protein [Spirochaetota bacterium]HPL17649.1 FecR family protein [Spirochaetota bacterium]HQF10011.1 FecR family protein [Spirochaetota bacterium]HQH98607.1 FecR family protein [Spirochaetota bacterium]
MTYNLQRTLLLSLIILGAAGCMKAARQAEPMTVSAILGSVSLNRPGSVLRPGDAVKAGDRIITGEKSMATLILPDTSLVRIFEKSEFTVSGRIAAGEGREADTVLSLDRGRTMLIVQKLAKGDRLRVKTPTAVAAVRGTTFDVSVREAPAKGTSGVTDVRVLNGTVYVEAKDKPQVSAMVSEGEMIALSNESVVEDKKTIPEKEMKELQEEEKDLGKAGTVQQETVKKKEETPARAGSTPPVLKTEAAIKEFYHKLEEVDLDDGTTLVGAVIFQNASVAKIHTSSGVIQVPTSSIKNIRMR